LIPEIFPKEGWGQSFFWEGGPKGGENKIFQISKGEATY